MKLTLALAATVAATLVGLPAQATPTAASPIAALQRGDLPTEYVQYRRFRSSDASSGTYLGNDGDRHPCP